MTAIAPQHTCPPLTSGRTPRHSTRTLVVILAVLATVVVLGVWASAQLVTQDQCDRYGSCTLATVMTFGTPV